MELTLETGLSKESMRAMRRDRRTRRRGAPSTAHGMRPPERLGSTRANMRAKSRVTSVRTRWRQGEDIPPRRSTRRSRPGPL